MFNVSFDMWATQKVAAPIASPVRPGITCSVVERAVTATSLYRRGHRKKVKRHLKMKTDAAFGNGQKKRGGEFAARFQAGRG